MPTSLFANLMPKDTTSSKERDAYFRVEGGSKTMELAYNRSHNQLHFAISKKKFVCVSFLCKLTAIHVLYTVTRRLHRQVECLR